MGWVGRATALVATGVLVGGALGMAPINPPDPAHAAPVASFGALQDAFTNPASVGGTASLTGALTGSTLALAAGTALTLDLATYTLEVTNISLGSGSSLRITTADSARTNRLTATGGILTSGASLLIDGYAQVTANGGSANSAAIGGGDQQSGGTITIRGFADVTATAPTSGDYNGAAIGGGKNGAGGTITIDGQATVTARAPSTLYSLGAAIGGGGNSNAHGGSGGVITIGGSAVVTAQSANGGAAIGGGDGGSPGTILIQDSATVNATGGRWGSAIGGGGVEGGDVAPGGDITIAGSATVTATATAGGTYVAGIGAGSGNGGAVRILGGSVSISATYALGARPGRSFGTVEIGAGATVSLSASSTITVTDGGSVVNAGVVTGTGRLAGVGLFTNTGAVTLATANVAYATLGVLPNNYLVTFDRNYPGGPTSTERVFAPTFTAGARSFPATPTRPGYTFLGWNTAAGGGGATFTTSTVITASMTVYAIWSPATTATTVSAIGIPAENRPTPMQASVANTLAPSDIPQGSVTVTVDGGPVGTFPLSGGTAAFTLPALPAGPHLVVAVYAPSGGWAPSTGSTTVTVLTTSAAATTLTITPSTTTPVQGATVTLTATAFDAQGASLGNVTALTTFTSSAAADTVAGNAVTTHGAGARTVTGTFGAVSGGAVVTASAAPATVTVTPQGIPVEGRAITVHAAVVAAASAGTPQGTVQLRIGGVDVGAPVALSGGQADLTWPSPTAGGTTIEVVYTPAPADWAAATGSATVTVLTVTDAAATLTITPSTATPVQGDTVTLTATAFDAQGASLGDVTSLTTFTSSAAADTVTGNAVTTHGAGARTVTGTLGAAGDTATITATPAATTVTATPQGIPVEGRAIDVAATVATAATAGTPAGRVQLVVDGEPIGPAVDLTAGAATLTWPSPTAGAHDIEVQYLPEPGDWIANSGEIEVTVLDIPTATASLVVTAGADPVFVGDEVPFTAVAFDADGVEIGDVSADTAFTSSDPVDAVSGATVAFTTAGTRTITGTFATTSGTVGVEVGPAASTTVVAPLTAVPVAGRALPIPVQITADQPNAPVPQGMVQLLVDGAPVGLPVVLDASGAATLVWAVPVIGDHTVSVLYNPSPEHWLASETALDLSVLSVLEAVVSIRITPDALVVPQGGAVTLTVEGFDANGDSLGDVTSATRFTSSVASDIIDGARVTFPSASPHRITGTVGDASDSVVIQVMPQLAGTGFDPSAALFAVVLLAGAGGVLVRRRRWNDHRAHRTIP
ncbi:InlB B-repeat-containing protein [Agromyces larvae]|uniref:InlB B-repeat-containing protein n=1 Tax=Agromyces larvae TaxID=2929802 RepID=A0ABY4C3H4_9MICO|nr:InlB B-repeat-containing protein [Agromyces larvae]UOE43330.1 InlB B-repeat-containing protein [Agromyces larvae]